MIKPGQIWWSTLHRSLVRITCVSDGMIYFTIKALDLDLQASEACFLDHSHLHRPVVA